jgi:hypothetical protein
MDFQLAHFRNAAAGSPVISISRVPMDLGASLLDPGPFGYWNIYRQLCRGAKLADTPYVAMAEDDVLYPPHHYDGPRPPADAVSYNRSRWSLFTWDAIYCLRRRISNCTLIAPRKLLIEALEERLARHPEGDSYPNQHVGEVGRGSVEQRLGVTNRKMVEWWSTVPVVQLNHPGGNDERQQEQHKAHGEIRAHDIPYWGKAREIAARYLGKPPHVDPLHGEVDGLSSGAE